MKFVLIFEEKETLPVFGRGLPDWSARDEQQPLCLSATMYKVKERRHGATGKWKGPLPLFHVESVKGDDAH